MGKRNIKRKSELVFNEEKRKEFLTGFSKRKLQRKKKAQEEFKIKVKEEQKRIRDEV
jgi:ribosomal RNA-processing protein 17